MIEKLIVFFFLITQNQTKYFATFNSFLLTSPHCTEPYIRMRLKTYCKSILRCLKKEKQDNILVWCSYSPIVLSSFV